MLAALCEAEAMRHVPTGLLSGTLIAERSSDTVLVCQRLCPPFSWGSLWCHGLVRYVCHKASARARQGFGPCREGDAAPSCGLPGQRPWERRAGGRCPSPIERMAAPRRFTPRLPRLASHADATGATKPLCCGDVLPRGATPA